MVKKVSYFNTNRSAKFIYGIILMFIFVVSQGHNSNVSALTLAVLAVFAAASFSFAEIYAEVIGERIKNKGKVSKKEKQNIVQDSLAIISVGLIVSIIFLLCSLGLYSLKNAFDISYFILLFLLFIFSFWAYKLSGYSALKSTLIAFVSVIFGIIIITFKYIVGH